MVGDQVENDLQPETMGFGKDRIEIIHRSKQRIEPGTLVASTMDFTLTSQALSKVSETSWQTRVGSSRLANVRISQRSDRAQEI